MPRRIAILLTDAFKPNPRIHKEASSLVANGYEVTIFAWDRTGEYHKHETINGIKIVRLRVQSGFQLGIIQVWYLMKYYIKVFRLIRRGRFHAIHCYDLLTLPMGVLFKTLFHKKLVYDAGEIYHIMEAERYPFPILLIIKYIEMFLLQFIDAFVVAGDIRARYYKKYYRKQIYVIGNWYDPLRIPLESRKKLRKRLGISEAAFCIGTCNILEPSRNIELLLEYAKKHPEVFLLICGEGSLRKTVEKYSKEYRNIEYLGWTNIIDEFLPAVDVLTYIYQTERKYSRYACPNTIYLSIAAVKPLLATRCGEIALLAQKYDCCVLCSPDLKSFSVNMAILKQENVNQKLAAKLSALQKVLSWKNASDLLQNLYDKLWEKGVISCWREGF